MLVRKFVLLVVLYSIVQFGVQRILISDDLTYEALISQLSYERISDALAQGKKWEWLSYAFLPFILFIKILFSVVCLSIGAIFLSVENGFKQFFTAATNAEFVFAALGFVKLIWFSFIEVNYTLQDLQFFSPLSALSLFKPTELDPWLLYPLQLLSVFEVLYWIVLAYQLKEILGKNFSSSFGFVAKTYGVGLFIWVLLVMFLIVSIS